MSVFDRRGLQFNPRICEVAKKHQFGCRVHFVFGLHPYRSFRAGRVSCQACMAQFPQIAFCARCSLRSFLALLPWIAQRSSTLNPESHIQGRKARRQLRAKALWQLRLGGSTLYQIPRPGSNCEGPEASCIRPKRPYPPPLHRHTWRLMGVLSGS